MMAASSASAASEPIIAVATPPEVGEAGDDENRCKVKLYRLCVQSGQWMDEGTGRIDAIQADAALSLVVTNEETPKDNAPKDGAPKDGNVLLRHDVSPHNRSYQQQQGTLIVWEEGDPFSLNSYALSFLVKAGCDDVWRQIRAFQARAEPQQFFDDDIGILAGLELPGDASASHMPRRGELVLPTRATLEQFVRVIQDRIPGAATPFSGLGGPGTGPSPTAALVARAADRGLIRRLLQLSGGSGALRDSGGAKVVGDAEARELVGHAFAILLHAVDDAWVELLLTPDAFAGVCAALDAYLESGGALAAAAAKIPASMAQLQEIAPVDDQDVREAIAQNARAQTLRDAAMSVVAADPPGTPNGVWAFEHFNYGKVYDYAFLQRNGAYVGSLIKACSDEALEPAQRAAAVEFLADLVRKLVHVPEQNRQQCYTVLFEQSAFGALQDALTRSAPIARRTAAVGLLCQIARHNLVPIRRECVEEHRRGNAAGFLDLLIRTLHGETDLALLAQLGEAMRRLLLLEQDEDGDLAVTSGPPPPTGATGAAASEFEDFLTVFYSRHVSRLMQPLYDVAPEAPADAPLESFSVSLDAQDLCCTLCSLLCFLMRTHGYRVKFAIMDRAAGPNRQPLFALATRLCLARAPHVQLAALKVVRTAVALSEKFWEDLLLGRNTLATVVAVYVRVKHRANLLNAACLEIFGRILGQPRRRLLEYLVRECFASFADVDHIDLFAAMKRRCDLWDSGADDPDAPASPTAAGAAPASPAAALSDAAAEERYFDDDADSGDDLATSPTRRRACALAKPAADSPERSRSTPPLQPLQGRAMSDEEDDEIDAGIFRRRAADSPSSGLPRPSGLARSPGASSAPIRFSLGRPAKPADDASMSPKSPASPTAFASPTAPASPKAPASPASPKTPASPKASDGHESPGILESPSKRAKLS